MEVIATIMSGLALLAAAVCFGLLMQEKKRSQKRNTALCELMEQERKALATDFAKLAQRVHDLEDGIIPDYEEAKKAADAMNDFNRGISNIWNFDPMGVMRKEQRKDNGKEGD